MDRRYGWVIWTNHALQRLVERGINQGDAWYTFQKPQQSRYARSLGAWIYYRTYGKQVMEVVAKQNEKREWIIIFVWSKKLHQASSKSVQKSGLLAKILKSIFGGNFFW